MKVGKANSGNEIAKWRMAGERIQQRGDCVENIGLADPILSCLSKEKKKGKKTDKKNGKGERRQAKGLRGASRGLATTAKERGKRN